MIKIKLAKACMGAAEKLFVCFELFLIGCVSVGWFLGHITLWELGRHCQSELC